MTSFNVIDVETANADRSSICQIGIVKVRNEKIQDEWVSLIDPEDWFDPFNCEIHGITRKMVAGQPILPKVECQLRELLEGETLVSHTSFDRIALDQAMSKYSLRPIQAEWLDSAKVVRRAWPDKFGARGYGLKNVANELGISFKHHDALEDARATAKIMFHVLNHMEPNLEDWRKKIKQPIWERKAKPSIKIDGNVNGLLYGETIVFTGQLSMTRHAAAIMAAEAGCDVHPSVTKETTLLVVGMQDASKLLGYSKSSKHRRAELLIAQGKDISIISEADFNELVKRL